MSYSTWKTYIANQPQCNFKVTRGPLTASFIHPGINHNTDRNGLINLVDLLAYNVDAYSFPQHFPYKKDEEQWFKWLDVRKDRSLFVSSVELTTSQSLHNRQLPKWPLEARCILRNVGKSTVAFQVESYIPGSKEPMMIYTFQVVSVDTITRKSKPLPDWFINKYKDQCLMTTGFQLKTFSRPKTTFEYNRQVMWLDTDNNNHCNFTSYVRFALDGLYWAIKQEHKQGDVASKSHTHSSDFGISSTSNDTSHANYSRFSADGASSPDSVVSKSDELHSSPRSLITIKGSSGGCLKGMTNDIIKRGIKSLKVCYVNECVEGDVVDVHIWQEDKEANIVRCSIEKGSQIICQLIFEYFGVLAKL